MIQFLRGVFRKWGWSDEGSHAHDIFVPYSDTNNWTKYAGNPISEGTGDNVNDCDGTRTSQMCVIVVGGVIFLYIMALDGTDYRIALKTAAVPNFYGPFTRYDGSEAKGAILDVGGGGAFDAGWLGNPWVIYDKEEADSEYRFKMYYSCANGGGTRAVGMAHSADGYSWTKDGKVTALTNFYQSSAGFRFGNIYLLWFGDTVDRTRLATSPDGRHDTWTDRGQKVDFDSLYVSLFWNQGIFYFLYGQPPNGERFVSMATGWDPFAIFSEWDENPVLSKAAAGWDSGGIMYGCIIQYDRTFYIYYDGYETYGVPSTHKIGVATIP